MAIYPFPDNYITNEPPFRALACLEPSKCRLNFVPCLTGLARRDPYRQGSMRSETPVRRAFFPTMMGASLPQIPDETSPGPERRGWQRRSNSLTENHSPVMFSEYEKTDSRVWVELSGHLYNEERPFVHDDLPYTACRSSSNLLSTL